MSALHVRLFGHFELSSREPAACEQSLTGKAKELFCYLLLRRNRPHSREVLASLFWPDATTAQSKKYLRQALWQLHSFLQRLANLQLLRINDDAVELCAGSDLWLDVAEVERAFQNTRGVQGENLEANQAQGLKQAVAVYQGELLEGWYHDWCLCERERLRGMHLAMLDKLMGYCEVRGDYELGTSYGEQMLQHDRGCERTYERLMRVLYRAGDRGAALRQYERCVAALRDELGVKPSERTKRVYEQIRTDSLACCCSEGEPVAGRSRARLDQLRALLLTLRQRIEQDLAEIDRELF
jgi:DNA-binding SARP family transcriptional activator